MVDYVLPNKTFMFSQGSFQYSLKDFVAIHGVGVWG